MHSFYHFFDSELLLTPEFTIQNKYISFKDKEIKFLTDKLEERETEEAKVQAAEKEATIGSVVPQGKQDNKKDPKGAAKGGKNIAPADDKNVPAQIIVEYAEIEEQPNFLIYEKQFKQKKPVAPKNVSKKGTPAQSNGAQKDIKT